MRKPFERVLPLNPDLEKAALQAVLAGHLDLKALHKDELSKLGKYTYQTLLHLNTKGPIKPKTVFLAATEVHGADPTEFKPYLKEIMGSATPEIRSILEALGRKRVINTLVNEASEQVSSGEYSLLALKGVLDKHSGTRNALVPLLKEMTNGEIGPPQGVTLPCLPLLNQTVGGVYGVWVLGGEPAAGKSTLALQISMSVGRRRPVLYYDFEQGTGVIKWHIAEALEGNTKRISEATKQLYVRHSMATLETDLDMLNQPCLVVVDSIQKVASSVTYRRESLESWIHKLEALKKYGHHVLLVSEKRRGTYGDARLDGYKETGELEYAADAAFDLLLPNEQDGSVVELHITKNRHYQRKGFLCELHRTHSWWFHEHIQQTREVD